MKQLDEIYCKVLKEQIDHSKIKNESIHVCKLCKTNHVLSKNQSCREYVFIKNMDNLRNLK